MLSTEHQTFSSVAQLCPTLCDPMDHSKPGLPVHHHLPEPAQTHVCQASMPSNQLIVCFPFSSCLQSFPASGCFPMTRFLATGGQSVGASVIIKYSYLPKLFFPLAHPFPPRLPKCFPLYSYLPQYYDQILCLSNHHHIYFQDSKRLWSSGLSLSFKCSFSYKSKLITGYTLMI